MVPNEQCPIKSVCQIFPFEIPAETNETVVFNKDHDNHPLCGLGVSEGVVDSCPRLPSVFFKSNHVRYLPATSDLVSRQLVVARAFESSAGLPNS